MAGPDRIPGRSTRRKCLPPPRRRGRMSLRRLADGRPAAQRPPPTNKTMQPSRVYVRRHGCMFLSRPVDRNRSPSPSPTPTTDPRHMKLLRALCDCGFVSRKARSGYHYHQWWFPVFSTDTSTLTDVRAALPKADLDRIDHLSFKIYRQTPSDDKERRREASAKMESLSRETHDQFIDRETRLLRDRFASTQNCVFDPAPDTVFPCPVCNNHSLILKKVHVVAFCNADCGHEYEWPDSETSGCPRCGYRPHRFQTEHEEQFANHPRTICWCPCSSSTDAISHVDGYCPKCGELPNEYQLHDVVFCGMHHERLLPYELPANFLFIETESRWVAHRFPNAKLWGDAAPGEEKHAGLYCPLCESDHQRWLQSHAVNDGEPSDAPESRIGSELNG